MFKNQHGLQLDNRHLLCIKNFASILAVKVIPDLGLPVIASATTLLSFALSKQRTDLMLS